MSRIFTLKNPLAEDLLFKSLTGTEQLSDIFLWDLTMLSPRNNIQAKELLGKGITIEIETEGAQRYLNAQITQFQKTGQEERYTEYQAKLRPWFWYATLSSDCRIYQHKNVVQIADEVLADYPFTVKKKLYDNYKEIGYCVQYNETDFDFLSRLFEQEGIYYYFEHQDGEHALVLADYIGSHKPLPDYEEIRYISADQLGTAGEECIHSWAVVESVRPGRYVTSDYDFKKPQAQLQQIRSALNDHAHADYEMYQWGHGYTDPAHGEHLTRVELERLQQGKMLVTGKTNARGMAPGHTFKLYFHPDDLQNAEYLITEVKYKFNENPYASGEDHPDWTLDFTVQKSTEQYRPAKKTPRPSVLGIHTAKVVGPPGEEIWCDKYGRVKLQFPWDRYGQSDENSSCWVRVSSPWAGGNFGGVNIPRIGQEVLIEYINGDINRPVIVGRVYNDFNMPPWGLPAAAVVSGLKSNTHKGSGYNEFSMDDTAGNEKITIHGQHDMNTTVRNDQANTIHNNQTNTIHKDQTNTIKNNQETTVDKDQTNTVKENQTNTIIKDQTTTVKQSQINTIHNDQTNTIQNNQTNTVNANRSTVVKEGNNSLTIDNGTHTVTVKKDSIHTVQDGDRSVTVANGNYFVRAEKNDASIHAQKSASLNGKNVAFVTSDKLVSVQAKKVQIGNEASKDIAATNDISAISEKITLQCDKSQISIDGSEIVLSHGMHSITINAEGITIDGTLLKLN